MLKQQEMLGEQFLSSFEKTTLYVAGGMKRAAPELSEDKVCI